MSKEKIKLFDIIFSSYYSQFKQKGFEDVNIIKNWKKLTLHFNISNADLMPIKIVNKTLYLQTSNKELYSEFLYLKKEIKETIVAFFGISNWSEIKLIINN